MKLLPLKSAVSLRVLRRHLVRGGLIALLAAVVGTAPAATPAQPASVAADPTRMDHLLQPLQQRLRENTRRILDPNTAEGERAGLIEENQRLKVSLDRVRAGLDPTPGGSAGPAEVYAAAFDLNLVPALLARFATFDGLDQRRRRDESVATASWRDLTRELARFQPMIEQVIATGPLTKDRLGHYALRTMLLLSLAELNTSAAIFKSPDRERMAEAEEHFRNAIVRLERIIQLATPEIDRLWLDARGPHAGLDRVGTWEWRDSTPTQTTTSYTARRLLAAHCPWGVPTMLMLMKAGMTGFRLPAAPGKPHMFNLFKRHGTGADWMIDYRGELPVHVRRVVTELLGSKDRPTAVIDRAEMGRETLTWMGAYDAQLRLIWMSPTSLETNITTSTVLGFCCNAAGWAVGGEGVAMTIGLEALDQALGGWGSQKVARYLEDYFDTDRDIRGTAEYVGYAWSIGKTAYAIKKGKVWDALTEAGELGFGLIDTQEREYVMKHLRPENHIAGITYNGHYVPPIFLTATVRGVLQGKSYEYPRYLAIRRIWQFHPEALLARPARAFDLSGTPPEFRSTDDYFSPNAQTREALHRSLWVLAAPPMGMHELRLELAPPLQAITVNLPPGYLKEWRAIRAGETAEPKLVVFVHPPDDSGPGYRKDELFNEPLTADKLTWDFQPRQPPPSTPTAPRLPPLFVAPGDLKADRNAANPRAYYLPALTNEYMLRIERNGEEVAKFLLNFGPASKSKPMAGEITQLAGGAVSLTCTYRADEVRPNAPIPVRANTEGILPPEFYVSLFEPGFFSPAGVFAKASAGPATVTKFSSDTAIVQGWYVAPNLPLKAYRMVAEVNGAKFILRGQLERRGGALRCSGVISVPEGSSRVRVYLENGPSTTIAVERSRRSTRAQDWGSVQASMIKAETRLRQEKGAFNARIELADACLAEAQAYANVGDDTRAVASLQRGLKTLPAEEAYGKKTGTHVVERLLSLAAEIAWRRADLRFLEATAKPWLAHRYAIAMNTRQVPEGLEYDYRKVCQQYVALGGDLNLGRQWWGQWLDCVALREKEFPGWLRERQRLVPLCFTPDGGGPVR